MDPKMTMEVPAQVREFAEKSVDQAERAISSFMDDSMCSAMAEAVEISFVLITSSSSRGFQYFFMLAVLLRIRLSWFFSLTSSI